MSRKSREKNLSRTHTPNVRTVTFSFDGKRIYSESPNDQLVWDVANGLPEANAKWDPPAEQEQDSPDGLWFVSNEFNHVLLVDREYRNTPHGKAYRLPAFAPRSSQLKLELESESE